MGSKKILIIDDNPDFLFTTETFLKRNGFATLTAQDGKKGVEMAQKEHPDLVLLDVMMETLYSGFEVCKRIKTDPASPRALLSSEFRAWRTSWGFDMKKKGIRSISALMPFLKNPWTKKNFSRRSKNS